MWVVKKMYEDNPIYKNKFLWLGVFVLTILLFAGGYIIYRVYNQPVEVQSIPQTIAETPQGVKIAADKAGYSLDTGQAKEVATTIREIRTIEKEPLYIVKTTSEQAKSASEQAKKDNKADFSIVTDKRDPDKVVDLNKLDKSDKVELNQYNIQSYKPVIRTVSITPDINDKGVKQVNFSISKKITKDGQYLGVGVGYDIKDKRALLNISYSW